MNKFIHWIRNWLGINHDVQLVAQNIEKLNKDFEKMNFDIFSIFNGLPFTAGILTLTAADAAKFVLPHAEKNSLVTILTGIVLATRQGQSSLQIEGDLNNKTREHLERRGFKIEEVTGSNDNKGLFVLWT